MKKRFLTPKLLIIAIILAAVTLTSMVVGFSGVFAEPDMKEIVGEQEFGTFEPNGLVGDEDALATIGWMETKVIGIQADLWTQGRTDKETGGETKQDILNNVYSYDNIEGKMFFDSVTVPIFQPLSETFEPNYYVMYYEGFPLITGVQATFYVGENTENGVILSPDEYFYDEEHGYLYVKRDIAQARFKEGALMPLRAETVFVFEDINTVSKEVTLITNFAENSNIPEDYKAGLANRAELFPIRECQMGDISYRLVDSNKLALFSRENMHVYIDGIEFDSWDYNENTGYLTLSANLLSIHSILVEIDAINDVTFEAINIQEQQADDELAPSASGLSDVVRDYNEYIEYLQYDDEMPKVGTHQSLDYVARVILGVTLQNGSKQSSDVVSVASNGRFPTDLVGLISQKAQNNGWLNGYLKSATWSTVPVTNGTDLMDNVNRNDLDVPKLPGDMSTQDYRDLYGEIAYRLYQAKIATSESDKEKYIGYANALANAYLFNFNPDKVSDSDYKEDSADPNGKQWPTNRFVDARWHTHCGTSQSRYVGGLYESTKTFLGGEVHGNVLIDGDCCQITASSSWAANVNQALGNSNSHGNNTDYQCGSSIIAVSAPGKDGVGDMWVCTWSESLQDTDDSGTHTQRIQSYSKIKYKYEGEGTLVFEKLNPEGQRVAGAKYAIYEKGSSTALETVVTSDKYPVELNLKKGDYTIKEIEPPTGYLKDDKTHSFTIKVNETTNIRVTDKYQLCNVEFTVYDKTTEGNSVEIPVAGIQFSLIDGNGDPVAFRNNKDEDLNKTYLTTNEQGKISFYVRTLDVTPAIQMSNKINGLYLKQLNDVTNYRKELDLKDRDYCHAIRISANAPADGVCPDNSGKHTSTTKKHYENRQWVDIKAHVQDKSLGSATTMSNFGGYEHDDGSTNVRLTDAVYNIMTTSDSVLLGYTDNGKAIYLKPNVLLGYDKNGMSSSRPVIMTTYASSSIDKAYVHISSTITDNTQQYTQGLTLTLFNVTVDGKSGESYTGWNSADKGTDGIYTKISQGRFELPNGTYSLVLSQPSNGYRRYENKQDVDGTPVYDGTGIHKDNKTSIDAEWVNEPSVYEKEILGRENEIVTQERQTVEIEAYVKGYVSSSKKTGTNKNGYLDYEDLYTVQNYTNDTIKKLGSEYYDSVDTSLHELPTIYGYSKKEVRTANKSGKISTDAKDYVTVYNKTSGAFSSVLSVETVANEKAKEYGLDFNNVFIDVYNLTTIVDVKTGKVIPALNSVTGLKKDSSPIGRYRFDSDGHITITNLSSGKMENPFVNETSNQEQIPATSAMMYAYGHHSLENGETSTNQLPNGVYYVRIYQYDENTQTEYGLAENILFDTAWDSQRVTNKVVSHDSLHLIQVDDVGPGVYEIHIAPDLPNSTTDNLRYDPNDVVNTKNQILIGDELDISKVLPSTQSDTDFTRALQWIDKHAKDFSYRIYEMINNDGSDDIADDSNVNTEVLDNLPTTFAMYINHDITPELNVEYNYYTKYYYQITKAEYDSVSDAEKKSGNYLIWEGIYYKKFTSNEMLNIFAFNSNSAGYMRYFEGGYEIDANKPVTGAVYNVNWLSKRMAAASIEGTYRILIEIDVQKTTHNWINNTTQVDHLNSGFGTIRIKNRHLFNLD